MFFVLLFAKKALPNPTRLDFGMQLQPVDGICARRERRITKNK
jgi:hypothetical protein